MESGVAHIPVGFVSGANGTMTSILRQTGLRVVERDGRDFQVVETLSSPPRSLRPGDVAVSSDSIAHAITPWRMLDGSEATPITRGPLFQQSKVAIDDAGALVHSFGRRLVNTGVISEQQWNLDASVGEKQLLASLSTPPQATPSVPFSRNAPSIPTNPQQHQQQSQVFARPPEEDSLLRIQRQVVQSTKHVISALQCAEQALNLKRSELSKRGLRTDLTGTMPPSYQLDGASSHSEAKAWAEQEVESQSKDLEIMLQLLEMNGTSLTEQMRVLQQSIPLSPNSSEQKLLDRISQLESQLLQSRESEKTVKRHNDDSQSLAHAARARQECRELQERIRAEMERSAKLESEVNSAQDQVKKLERENRLLQSRLVDALDECKSLEETIAFHRSLSEERQKQKNDVVLVANGVMTNSSSRSRNEGSSSDSDDRNHPQYVLSQSLQREVIILQKQLQDQTRQWAAQQDNYEQVLRNQQIQLQEQQEEHDRILAQQRQQESASEIARKQQELSDLETLNALHKQQLEKLQDHLVRQHDQIKRELDQENSGLREQLSQLVAKLETTVVENQNLRLERQKGRGIEDIAATRREAMQDDQPIERENETLNDLERGRLSSSNDAIGENGTESQQESNKLSSLTEELDRLRTEKINLERMLMNAREEGQRLREQLDDQPPPPPQPNYAPPPIPTQPIFPTPPPHLRQPLQALPLSTAVVPTASALSSSSATSIQPQETRQQEPPPPPQQQQQQQQQHPSTPTGMMLVKVEDWRGLHHRMGVLHRDNVVMHEKIGQLQRDNMQMQDRVAQLTAALHATPDSEQILKDIRESNELQLQEVKEISEAKLREVKELGEEQLREAREQGEERLREIRADLQQLTTIQEENVRLRKELQVVKSLEIEKSRRMQEEIEHSIEKLQNDLSGTEGAAMKEEMSALRQALQAERAGTRLLQEQLEKMVASHKQALAGIAAAQQEIDASSTRYQLFESQSSEQLREAEERAERADATSLRLSHANHSLAENSTNLSEQLAVAERRMREANMEIEELRSLLQVFQEKVGNGEESTSRRGQGGDGDDKGEQQVLVLLKQRTAMLKMEQETTAKLRGLLQEAVEREKARTASSGTDDKRDDELWMVELAQRLEAARVEIVALRAENFALQHKSWSGSAEFVENGGYSLQRRVEQLEKENALLHKTHTELIKKIQEAQSGRENAEAELERLTSETYAKQRQTTAASSPLVLLSLANADASAQLTRTLLYGNSSNSRYR